MKKLILMIISSILLAGITACNTMEGVGKDVQTAGEKLEESAKRPKEE